VADAACGGEEGRPAALLVAVAGGGPEEGISMTAAAISTGCPRPCKGARSSPPDGPIAAVDARRRGRPACCFAWGIAGPLAAAEPLATAAAAGSG